MIWKQQNSDWMWALTFSLNPYLIFEGLTFYFPTACLKRMEPGIQMVRTPRKCEAAEDRFISFSEGFCIAFVFFLHIKP